MVKTLPSNAADVGSVSSGGAKIPQTTKTRQKQYCNKFNKDFKNGSYPKKKKSFHGGSVVKNLSVNARDVEFNPWVRKIPWRRKWQPTSSILDWKIPWTEEPRGL